MSHGNIGGGDAESCIDWIQVDVSGPTPILEQQQTGGAYGSAGDFRYYPDLAVDRNNNIAIGYTKSSWNTHTEVWITGREVDDTAGALQPEALQRAGLGNYVDGAGCQGTCDRWGDYTGMTVDPDGCTFWYLGQYSDGGYFNWGTHIGSFKLRQSCSVDSSLQVDKGSYHLQRLDHGHRDRLDADRRGHRVRADDDLDLGRRFRDGSGRKLGRIGLAPAAIAAPGQRHATGQ